MKQVRRNAFRFALAMLGAMAAPIATSQPATQTEAEPTTVSATAPDGMAWAKIAALRDEPITSREMALKRLPEVITLTEVFERDFPQSPMVSDSILLRIDAADLMRTVEGNDSAEAARVFQALAERSDLPPRPALELVSRRLQPHFQLLQDGATSATAAALIGHEVEAFDKLHPDTEQAGTLWLMLAQIHVDFGDPAEANEIYEKLKSSKSPRLREQAEAVMRGMNIVGSTPELKFTALDGRAVDLADYRGKVVLVDFWATWCVPCIIAMPEIKEVYDKYHAQGFEVIGINLDEDRGAVETFLAERKLAWPHYFDGKRMENEIANYYYVTKIPHTWLIDRTGKVVATETRGMLESQVVELLK